MINGVELKSVERGGVDTPKEGRKELTDMVDSEVSLEYMLEVLTTYYKWVGYSIEARYSDIVLRGEKEVVIAYSDAVGIGTIWDESVLYEHKYALLHRLTGYIDSVLGLSGFRFRPHQIGEAQRVWSMISNSGWALLRHMPRTGKTGTALLALEHSTKPMNVLIITTKNAVRGIGSKRDKDEGWMGFIAMGKEAGWFKHNYQLTTPHQLHKLPEGVKWDIVLIDESHKIYSDPKPTPSQLWTYAKHIIGDARVMYITATPHAQSINQLYWQLALCSYSPFGAMTWKQYWAEYGIDKQVIVGNGKAIPVWTEGKVEDVIALIGGCVSTLSQESVGFKEELLPIDVPHYVELEDSTLSMIQELREREMINMGDKLVINMNSRDGVLREHQIEGSTLKYVDVFSITDKDTGVRMRGVKPMEYNWILGGMEKVKYIKEVWGDVSSLVIMYHYVNEGKLLRREFKNAKVVQGKTHSEGIDLYMYDTMVIYSMDWSVATYIQRRDRQVSLTNRTKAIEVHYLLVKGMVSDAVYDSVVKKGVDLTMKYYS